MKVTRPLSIVLVAIHTFLAANKELLNIYNVMMYDVKFFKKKTITNTTL